jgi:hypothetical protein
MPYSQRQPPEPAVCLIVNLPVEIIWEIRKHLSVRSLLSLAATRKELYECLLDEQFWTRKCLEEFPWAFYNGFCLGLNTRDHDCEYRHQSFEFGRELSDAYPLGHLLRSHEAPPQPVTFSYKHAYLSIFFSKVSFLVEFLDPRTLTIEEVYATYHRNLDDPKKGLFHCTSSTRFSKPDYGARKGQSRRNVYKVVDTDYLPTYTAASPGESDKIVNATRLVQHPAESHKHFRRIIEHILPVHSRNVPDFWGIDVRPIKDHYDWYTSNRSDTATHPYLKPLSVGDHIEVEEWDRASCVFRSRYGIVEQPPVEGNNKFTFSHRRFTLDYSYSKMDGVRYKIRNSTYGCIRRVICKREKEQWDRLKTE